LHSSTVTLDRHRGVPTQTVDANGKTTTLSYDPLGRLLKVWLPGRSTSLTGNVEHTYTLRSTGANPLTTRRLGPNGNQIVGVSLYDGRFRPRQTQAVAPDGQRVVADTAYDNRGLVAKRSLFYNNSSGPAEALVSFTDANVLRQTTNTYDQVGRVTDAMVKSAGAELWRTTITYDGDRIAVTPPTGGTATTTINDARGRTVELVPESLALGQGRPADRPRPPRQGQGSDGRPPARDSRAVGGEEPVAPRPVRRVAAGDRDHR
jgi:YD repeat-containing protein